MHRIIPNHAAGDSAVALCRIVAYAALLVHVGAGGYALYLVGHESGQTWHVVAGFGLILTGVLMWAVLAVLAYVGECVGFIAQNTPLHIAASGGAEDDLSG